MSLEFQASVFRNAVVAYSIELCFQTLVYTGKDWFCLDNYDIRMKAYDECWCV